MNKIFETIVDTYLDNKVGIVQNFLNKSLASGLRENLLLLFNSQQFLNAGIGNDVVTNQDDRIRKDKIYWLDPDHHDIHEDAFFKLMDSFVHYLNSTCYTGITSYEFHYAMYEKGSYYKKHSDQFLNDKSRAFSMIMYLNADWQTGDGGELCIYHADHRQIISPDHAKSVFFKSSELEHEVLLTQKSRMSITGWLKTNE